MASLQRLVTSLLREGPLRGDDISAAIGKKTVIPVLVRSAGTPKDAHVAKETNPARQSKSHTVVAYAPESSKWYRALKAVYTILSEGKKTKLKI